MSVSQFYDLFFLTVNLKQCLRTSDLVSSTDPNFVVLEDGAVYTTNAVSLSSEKKAFSIVLKDLQEHKQKEIHVNLLSHPKRVSDHPICISFL